MLDRQLIAFIGIATILTITPGADTMLVLRSTLAHTTRTGLITMAGICSGLFVHALLSALGLSVLLMRSATAFEVVKIVGAGYIIVLGLQSLVGALRNRGTSSEFQPADQSLPVPRLWRFWLDGLLSNVLNPKVALFYLAFLPQFIQPNDSVLLRSLVLTCIHVALSVFWFSFIAVLVGRMAAVLVRPQVRRTLEGITGTLLIVLGVRLGLARR